MNVFSKKKKILLPCAFQFDGVKSDKNHNVRERMPVKDWILRDLYQGVGTGSNQLTDA